MNKLLLLPQTLLELEMFPKDFKDNPALMRKWEHAYGAKF